jgi:hypothetical protein
MAWIATISGVMLGGHLVFRAGRSSAGSLFHVKRDGKEGVAEIDDGLGTEPLDAPDMVLDQNERFKAIFKTNLEG